MLTCVDVIDSYGPRETRMSFVQLNIYINGHGTTLNSLGIAHSLAITTLPPRHVHSVAQEREIEGIRILC